MPKTPKTILWPQDTAIASGRLAHAVSCLRIARVDEMGESLREVFKALDDYDRKIMRDHLAKSR